MGDVFVLAFFIIFTVFLHIVNVNQYNVNIINVPIHSNASIFLAIVIRFDYIIKYLIFIFIHLYIYTYDIYLILITN